MLRSLVDLMAAAGSIPVDEAGRLKVQFHWDLEKTVAKLLKKGSKGSEVESLQQGLNGR